MANAFAFRTATAGLIFPSESLAILSGKDSKPGKARTYPRAVWRPGALYLFQPGKVFIFPGEMILMQRSCFYTSSELEREGFYAFTAP